MFFFGRNSVGQRMGIKCGRFDFYLCRMPLNFKIGAPLEIVLTMVPTISTDIEF